MQYLHHLGIFAFTLKLGGVLHNPTKPERNTIPTPSCDNILNQDTNEGIVKSFILMIKGTKIITKMRILQLHFKTLLNKPYTINVANWVIPSCTFTQQLCIGHL